MSRTSHFGREWPDPKISVLSVDVFTVEYRHLHLLDRKIVGGARVDLGE
jgi:hypothetical protein